MINIDTIDVDQPGMSSTFKKAVGEYVNRLTQADEQFKREVMAEIDKQFKGIWDHLYADDYEPVRKDYIITDKLCIIQVLHNTLFER